eukprot:m.87326 g.87326  ORF g.87326 m.87326 type:complete len:610 (-) comp12826_c0_seq1:150-1979(-)
MHTMASTLLAPGSTEPLVLPIGPADASITESFASSTASVSEDFSSIPVATAGKWIHQLVRHQRLSLGFIQSSRSDDEDDDEEDDVTDQTSASQQKQGNDEEDFVNITGDFKDQDHYAMLGLGDVRWEASQSQIKKSYRKMVLKHHPDKKGELSPEEAKKAAEYFSRIQQAFELLSDPKKRTLYDSVDDVDDDIPPKCKDPKTFYHTFGPVMKRNSKWLRQKPVPSLGDDATDIETVESYYKFWYSATSWREFGFDDEYDPNTAECREERRWMMKQNKAERKRKKKAENVRMQKLIDHCYASDPRIQREKIRVRVERERRRLEREEAKKKAEEERLQKIKEEEEAKQRAIQEEKDQRKKEVEAAKRARRAITKACKLAGIYNPEAPLSDSRAAEEGHLTQSQMEKFRTFTNDEMYEMAKTPPEELKEKILSALQAIEDAKAAKAKAKEGAAVEMKPWSEEEQKLLEDAIKAVPASDAKRWTKIAALVPGRKKKECIARIKECTAKVQAAKATTKPPAAWTALEEQVLTKAASKVFPPGTQNDRWQQIAEYLKIHAKTGWIRPRKQIISKVQDLKRIGSTLQKQNQVDAFQQFEKGKSRSKARPDEMTPSS